MLRERSSRRRMASTAAAALVVASLLLSSSPSPATAAGRGGELRMKHSDGGYSYNRTLAHILVQYASAVYTSDLTSLFAWTCPRCQGDTKGFEMIEIIVDVENCLQAFVGIAPDPLSIIIAFRGTQEHSVSNWIEDLFWKQLDVGYPGMPDAMVHHGFYTAYYNTTVRHEILESVRWARKTYGRLPINVVGHSMGGALASFCALDLSVKYGSQEVQLMTFGQPRVGNPSFAAYFSDQVPRTIRVTHQNDIVPHLPPYFCYLGEWTYHHFSREIWLHETVIGNVVTKNETICDGSGEDPTCSRYEEPGTDENQKRITRCKALRLVGTARENMQSKDLPIRVSAWRMPAYPIRIKLITNNVVSKIAENLEGETRDAWQIGQIIDR
uniref:Fungal lipase-type domain-containing protein n=1 Tax=Oryza punctata TaxID=4537 RepID=A0A0E0MHT3_ORYPU